MLSKETLDILAKLSKINQTLKIVAHEPKLKSLSTNQGLFAKVDITEDFPRDFHIYDLSEFINAVSIIKEPVIDLSNPLYAVIKSQDDSYKMRYIDGEESYITSYTEKDMKLPSSDILVDISEQQLKMVMTAAKTLRLDYIGLRGDGTNIYFRAFSINDGDDSEQNEFEVQISDSEDVFDAMFKTENVQFLENSAEIIFDAKHKIAQITCGGIEYTTGLDNKSSFEDA